MDVVLITLGVLGMGAVLVSAWVFMVAARNYVTEEPEDFRSAPRRSADIKLVERSATDRRRGQPVTFPLMVNGILIEKDRRTLPDRRKAA
ncbi:MAG: hypothetical protein Hals2KO_09040 [Halioglobus sp.]